MEYSNIRGIRTTVEDVQKSLDLNMIANIRLSFILSSKIDSLAPHVIPEFLAKHKNIKYAPIFFRSGDLYQYLKANSKDVIYFDDEKLLKRKVWIRLLEGAICSNRDGEPWRVSYNFDSFIFRGKIILRSQLNKVDLKSNKNLSNLVNNCQFY